MLTLESGTHPRRAPQEPSRRAHDGLPRCRVSPAMRRWSGLRTNDPGSPSTAVGRGSARRVLSTQHPRGSLARHALYAQGPDSEKGDAAMRTSFRRKRPRAIHRGVPGTLVPCHLPKTCPWAPGYLEAGCCPRIHLRAFGSAPPNISCGTMPTCPHPLCLCGHKNVTPDALLNHVQTSPWAHLYLCPTCKCVCKSETVLTQVPYPCAVLRITYADGWMGLQHKQKVHKIGFYATPASPQLQPRASSSAAISCRICDRMYTSTSALEQHFRDTPVHPKCSRCNVGFLDNTAIQAVSPLLVPLFILVRLHTPPWAKAYGVCPSYNSFAWLFLPSLQCRVSYWKRA